MIYDPTDVNMCMNELGVLFYLRADKTWAQLDERRRPENHPDDFTRPAW